VSKGSFFAFRLNLADNIELIELVYRIDKERTSSEANGAEEASEAERGISGESTAAEKHIIYAFRACR
jgi:hypothetical protein